MMMVAPTLAFGFSTPDIVLILVVALLLFGPKNLPKMARTIGKSMEEFRRAAREIENEIMKEPEPTTPPPPPSPEPETTPTETGTPEGVTTEGEPTAAEHVPGSEATAAVVVAEEPVPVTPPTAAGESPAVTAAPIETPAATEATVPLAAPPSVTTEPSAAPANPPVEKTPDVKPAP